MDGLEEPTESAGRSPKNTASTQKTGRRFHPRLFVLASLLTALLTALFLGGSSGLYLVPPGPSTSSTAATHVPAASVPKAAAPVTARSQPSAPSAQTSATAKGRSQPPASAPLHLTIASAGIDMPVLPLTPTGSDVAGHSIVPPMTFDAYWLTSYGIPGKDSANTTYIIGHSGINQDAPFNKLSTSVKVGDTFVLTTGSGKIKYEVVSVATHDKNTLVNSDIWRVVPNKVVLISCYTEDPWGKNVVVSALPAA